MSAQSILQSPYWRRPIGEKVRTEKMPNFYGSHLLDAIAGNNSNNNRKYACNLSALRSVAIRPSITAASVVRYFNDAHVSISQHDTHHPNGDKNGLTRYMQSPFIVEMFFCETPPRRS